MNRWIGENNPHPKPTIFVVQTRSFCCFCWKEELCNLGLSFCYQCLYLLLYLSSKPSEGSPQETHSSKSIRTDFFWLWSTPARGFQAPFFSEPLQFSSRLLDPSEEVLHWRTLRWNLAKKMGGNKRRKHNLPEVSRRCFKSCFFEGGNSFWLILPETSTLRGFERSGYPWKNFSPEDKIPSPKWIRAKYRQRCPLLWPCLFKNGLWRCSLNDLPSTYCAKWFLYRQSAPPRVVSPRKNSELKKLKNWKV